MLSNSNLRRRQAARPQGERGGGAQKPLQTVPSFFERCYTLAAIQWALAERGWSVHMHKRSIG
eukprot:9022350-Alexandrium_andersonii.AAC.1